MQGVLITGTDTDVGKTWVAATLLQQLRQSGIRVGAYKPVCSGAETDADRSVRWHDVQALTTAAQLTDDQRVCPQRFQAFLAPNVAARLEQTVVDDDLLQQGFYRWSGSADLVVVEGAGGLLAPLSDQSTVADLAVRLQLPLVLVAANRLGVLNHTLLTTCVAEQVGLNVLAIVLNDVTPDSTDTTADAARHHNAAELARLVPQFPLFSCEYQSRQFQPRNPAAESAGSLANLILTAAPIITRP